MSPRPLYLCFRENLPSRLAYTHFSVCVFICFASSGDRLVVRSARERRYATAVLRTSTVSHCFGCWGASFSLSQFQLTRGKGNWPLYQPDVSLSGDRSPMLFSVRFSNLTSNRQQRAFWGHQKQLDLDKDGTDYIFRTGR